MIQERGDRAADAAVGDLLAARRRHQPFALYRARREGATGGRAGRASAAPRRNCAALIPIRKNAAWWELTQQERRRIFEDKSHHIANSLKYLPAVARQLYHCRDLGEPFDFLTWFEYAPEHAAQFEELVAMLRATEEWNYVEREVDTASERGRRPDEPTAPGIFRRRCAATARRPSCRCRSRPRSRCRHTSVTGSILRIYSVGGAKPSPQASYMSNSRSNSSRARRRNSSP